MAYQEIGQTLPDTVKRAGPRFKYNAGLRAQWENGLSGEIAYHWVGVTTNPLSQRFVGLSALWSHYPRCVSGELPPLKPSRGLSFLAGSDEGQQSPRSRDCGFRLQRLE
jgi:hypothetical protein